MTFLWYGPFRYEEQTSQETVRLFERIEAARRGLEHGLGVYIFAVLGADGKPKPCYVGKASKHDMGGRIVSHLNKDKFLHLIEGSNGISLYLVASVDANQQMITKGNLSTAEHHEIEELERAFIGSAHARNERDLLLNIRGRRSARYLPIEGYVSPGIPGDNNDELAELLRF